MAFSRRSGSLMLLLAAVIWGSAFVAQSLGMEHIGPFTFQAVRSLLGAVALAPVILLSGRISKRKGDIPSPEQRRLLRRGGLLCGLALFVAVNLQQFGLRDTTAGKAGFLTALYILIVPAYGLFLGHRPRPALWVSVLVAAAGLYLLSVTEQFTVRTGDLLLILCAFAFAAQIMLVDHYGVRVNGVKLCAAQFLVCGALSGVAMLLFERPAIGPVLDAAGPLLYAGVLSSGVAYTLQILAQRTTPPAVASLMMSLEAVFAVLAGMLVLGEQPTPREYAGSGLMFAAILIAQRAEGPRLEKEPLPGDS
ncbi:MAG: DMT family transporter [Clostridiales bacterium]|nr:DMT family transporter [Clostridiales bacterium]